MNIFNWLNGFFSRNQKQINVMTEILNDLNQQKAPVNVTQAAVTLLSHLNMR